MVNRIWHYHFGRGSSARPATSAPRASRPTHPELLDWLAGEFVKQRLEHQGDAPADHDLAAYRQSSADRPAAAADDPDNKLLWRFPRQRLEGGGHPRLGCWPSPAC